MTSPPRHRGRGGFLLAVALLLVGCRQGGLAGTGVPCQGDHDCRAGFTCQSGSCRAVADVDAAETPDVAAGADSASPAADRALAGDTASTADLAIVADAADAVDVRPNGPPSLARGLEYRFDGQFVLCTAHVPATVAPTSVAFSPDGRLLASATSDGNVRLWSVTDEELSLTERTFPGGADNALFTPDGKYLVAGDTTIAAWSASGANVATAPSWTAEAGQVLGFSADSRRMLYRGTGPSVRIWSLAKKAVDRELKLPLGVPFDRDLAATSAGHWWLLFAAAGPTSQLEIVDVNVPGAQPAPVTTPVLSGATRATVALSADGGTMALADGDGLSLWRIDAGAATRLPGALRPPEPAPNGSVTALAFSARGDFLIAGAAATDVSRTTIGEVVIYDVAQRKPLFARTIWGRPARAAFSPDGRAIAVAIPSCGSVLYCRD
jgi:WD40 repeat protein